MFVYLQPQRDVYYCYLRLFWSPPLVNSRPESILSQIQYSPTCYHFPGKHCFTLVNINMNVNSCLSSFSDTSYSSHCVQTVHPTIHVWRCGKTIPGCIMPAVVYFATNNQCLESFFFGKTISENQCLKKNCTLSFVTRALKPVMDFLLLLLGMINSLRKFAR